MSKATLILLLVLVVALVVWVAVGIARRVQAAIDREKAKTGQEKTGEHAPSWLGHIHSIWWVLGVAAGVLKYIYRAWRTAPEGSAAKLGWGALLAFIVALGLFAALKLLDRCLNPPDDAKRELAAASAAEENNTFTHGRWS